MSPSPLVPRKLSTAATFLLLLFLGLAFQGSRGLWEPDEGRHGSIAVSMLASGDWMIPNLSGLRFIDKPPMLFWGMAGGVALLGQNEWGARLCLVLFYLATAVAIAGLGRALWNRETGNLAALIWGTSLLPFVASNSATPDLPLACFAAWSWLGVVHASRATSGRERIVAWLLAGVAAGLGILTKGPALLVELPPLLGFVLADRRLRPAAILGGIALAGTMACAVGGLWYAPILRDVTGAREYLIDNQISGRLVGASYQRHPGLAGALMVYLPTLVAGAFPWWPGVVAAVSRRARATGWSRFAADLRSRPAAVLVGAGILVPVVVFSLAASKLPLYLLPVLTPLALAGGRTLGPRWATAKRLQIGLLVWLVALLALKAAAAYLPTGARDSRALAQAITHRVDLAKTGVVVVSAQANGLQFYGVKDFHWLSSGDKPYPLFETPPKIETALPGIVAEGRPILVLCSPAETAEMRQRFERFNLTCGAAERFERLAGFVCSQAGGAGQR